MKPEELAEELHDKHAELIGDTLFELENVSGRDVVYRKEFIAAIITACDQTKAETIEKVILEITPFNTMLKGKLDFLITQIKSL